MNTTHTYPSHNLEFTHDVVAHEYVQPRYGHKRFFSSLGFVGLFFLLCIVEVLSDRHDHLPLDYGTVAVCFLGPVLFFGAIYYFPFCQQTRPDKAIIWLPTKENNPQDCLHIRSKNIHFLLGITLLFSFFLMLLCAAHALGTIPPTQVLQPWNWIRTTPFNLKADLICATADGSLIFFILLIIFFPRWHIIYTPNDLHIYRNLPIQHRTVTILNHSWEQLATVDLIQCNTYNSDKPNISSTITLNNGQEKTFKLFPSIFADPCWMTFLAHTLTNLPDTTSRQNFLTNLHQYAPPKLKLNTPNHEHHSFKSKPLTT